MRRHSRFSAFHVASFCYTDVFSNAWQLPVQPRGSRQIEAGLRRRAAGTRSGRPVAQGGAMRLLHFGITFSAAATNFTRCRPSSADRVHQ
jgi:hypothetical protein